MRPPVRFARRRRAVSLVESPLKVLDPEHETHLLAKGKPEAGPEDPANEPVVAAILRNPNRMRNAESPSPDMAACSPGPAHVSCHTYVSNFRRVFRDRGRKSEWRVALVPQSLGVEAALQVLHPDGRPGGHCVRHLEAPDARHGCAGARSRMQPVGRQAVQGAKRPRLQTSAEGRNVEFEWDYSATRISLAF